MVHLPRLRREEALLFIVDVQDRLINVMMEGERIVYNVALLARAARQLDMPVLVAEQNPERLGHTVPAVREVLQAHAGQFAPISKMQFSACTPEVRDYLAARPHSPILLCGTEAHVCVMQTALDLIELGHTVYVAADAISSRQEWNRKVGWERMRLAGAIPTSTESAIFELLGEAGTDEFRALLPLIK